MTDLHFSALDEAVAIRDRDWPNAAPLLGLSAWLHSDVRCDYDTGTIIILNDMSGSELPGSPPEPSIYLSTVPGLEWTSDADFTDLMSDRASERGTDPDEISILRSALDELADVYGASLRADRPRNDGSPRSVASALAMQENDLQARLALTRMLRAHLVRGLVAEAPPSADMDPVDFAMRYPVESFEELVVLVNEHRRLMGEV